MAAGPFQEAIDAYVARRETAAGGSYSATLRGPEGFHLDVSGDRVAVAAALRAAVERLDPPRPAGPITRADVTRASAMLGSIHGGGPAAQARERGQVVLIDREGEFLYPDNPEDQAEMMREHNAVPVRGLICRALVCICLPGTGHKSHPDPAPR